MAQGVTLDDVARESGVSRATASRALNDRDGVRNDVRQRVRMAAEALGYRPNRAAQNLAGGNASIIGLVVGLRDIVNRPYITMLMQEVTRAADLQNHALLLIMDAEDPNEAVRKLLGDRLVDGVIVSVVAAYSEWVEQMVDAALPAVIIGNHTTQLNVSTVAVENKASSAAIVGHMMDTGCARVATITGPLHRADAVERLEGYRMAPPQRAMPVDEALIFAGDYSSQRGFDLAEEVLDRGADAVFCANDDAAQGVHRWAVGHGIQIPEQLSVAGFDGTAVDQFDGFSLTSAAQPFRQMAEAAVELLIGQISGSPSADTRMFVPQLVYGTTTRSTAP